jgi:hypothetical protein
MSQESKKELTKELIFLIEEGDVLSRHAFYTNSDLKRVPHDYQCTVLNIIGDKINGKDFFIGIVVKYTSAAQNDEVYQLFEFGEIEWKFNNDHNIKLLSNRLKKSD